MVRVPNRGSVHFLNQIIHYVNGENLGLAKGGPHSRMARFVRRSDTGSPLYQPTFIHAKNIFIMRLRNNQNIKLAINPDLSAIDIYFDKYCRQNDFKMQ